MNARTFFTLVALVAASAIVSNNASAQMATGQNLESIVYGKNGTPTGTIFQSGPRRWIEQNIDGRFDFRELGRDRFSVYLEKVGRQGGMRVTLNLHTMEVSSGNHVFYKILQAKAKPAPVQPQKTTVRRVVYGKNGTPTGTIFQNGPGRWVEQNIDGRFDFRELGRDQFSVYLEKVGRQGGMRVTLNLHTREVSSNGYVFYKILSSN